MTRAQSNAQVAKKQVAGTGNIEVNDLETQAAMQDVVESVENASDAANEAGLPATYQQANVPHMELPVTPKTQPATTPAQAQPADGSSIAAVEAPDDDVPDADLTDAELFAREELRKTRREAARYRTALKQAREQLSELDSLKQRLAEIEEQSLSDGERRERQLERERSRVAELQQREADLTRRERERMLEVAVIRESRKLRIQDEDAAIKLMDRDELEFDEDGAPTNVEAVLRKLIQQRGYLVAPSEAAVRPSPANAPRKEPEAPNAPKAETPEERRLRIYGNGASLWADPRRQGGGVFMDGKLLT
jgi:hypothetical protein